MTNTAAQPEGYSLNLRVARQARLFTWRRSVARVICRGTNLFHLPPISSQLVTAFGEDVRSRDSAVFLRRLFYLDQRRFFEAGQLY
jgi:hypothetical protein